VNDGLPDVIIVDQAGVNVGLLAFLCNAVTRGGIALRVKVNHENLFAQRSHAGRKVDAGGRFANAALLVCDCNYFCHFTLHVSFGTAKNLFIITQQPLLWKS